MERMKRWLSLVLILVLVLFCVPINVSGIAAPSPIDVSFVPNSNWREADAWFAVYYWKNNTDSHWIKMDREGLFYTAEIPEGYTNIIFARMDPAKTTMDWSSVWNQTNDLTVSASKPVFILNAGWVQTGTWIAKPTSYDYYLAGSLNGVDVGVGSAANQAAYKFVSDEVAVTLTSDSYVCVGVQTGSTKLGNYMAQAYVDSGDTATMYIDGGKKLFVPAGTYTFTLEQNTDGSVTLRFAHAHNMTYHSAVGATCTASGNVAYYSCSGCLKNFADEAGATELTEITVAPSHNMTYHSAMGATCFVGGNVEYYSCSVCQKNFADEAGTTELTDVTVAPGHNMEHTEAAEAFCGGDGNPEYYRCTSCWNYFADEAGTIQLSYEDLTIPAVGDHNFGDNGFCTNEANGVVCNIGYEPAVLVTADNYAALGLSGDYIGYYAIQNAGQLYWFAEKVNYENDTYGAVNAVLTDNITVNSGTVTAESTGLRTWDSMGFAYTYEGMMGHVYMYDVSYRGTFDGNGKTISGIYGTSGGNSPMEGGPKYSQFTGFIGNLGESGRVQNLTIANSYFGGNTAGCIAGWNRGTITGCFNAATANGWVYAGGIAGANTGVVERCGNSGYLITSGNFYDQYGGAGGIVGQNAGVVRNCWNTGTVSANNNSSGGIVGGQVRYINVWYSEHASDDIRIENCWSTGNLRCGNNGFGAGIVAYLEGETVVDNCYTGMMGDMNSGAAEPIYLTNTDNGTPTVTDVETKTEAQFASGEVAYLLQKDQPSQVWGQNIDNGKTVQIVPTFNGAKVYYGYASCADTQAKYTNDATISADPIPHDWEYTAVGAEITGQCLNECGTDGGKVTLVLDGSAIYDGTEKTVKIDGALTGVGTLPAVTYEGGRVNVGTFTAYLTLEDGTKAELPVRIIDLEEIMESLDDVTEEDREDLEKAKDILEDALENYGDNYTEEQKEIIQEVIDQIEDALEVLDKIENVEDMIEALPETVKPDDEEAVAAIEAAKKAYDELTDREKEMVDQEAVEKLEGLVTALTYEFTKGNGLTWAKGTGARPAFTVNGPYSKFVGILVDGKEVAESNYEARQGSTVITLKTAYIEGLTQGKHTITVLYTNGQADGYFYITVMSDAPATGDTTNVALWSGLALISLLAAAALVLGKKRLSV